MIPGFSSGVINTSSIERFSLPTNFGRRYKSLLKRAANISLIYHATCTAIKLQENGKVVTKLVFRNDQGQPIEIFSKKYVLAMGGLETTRLLLSSNDVMPNGIGNDSDLLGRFYMCHLAFNTRELKLSPGISNVIFGYEKSKDGVYCRQRITLSPESQRKHKIGNLVARFYYPNPANPDHGSGMLSTLFLAKNLLQPEYRGAFNFKEILKKMELGETNYTAHLKNIIFDFPRTILLMQAILRKRFLARRKLPSVVFKSQSNAYPLEVNIEQSPNPNSRITLIKEKCAYGMPKLHVDWRINDIDRQTLKTGLNIIHNEFQASGCGELNINEQDFEQYWPVGGHHIGTTRMANSPSEGVVDENCKIHGVSNLFIASSSVFPTSSHANPTLTIIALAIRLADHLKKDTV